MAAKNRIRPAMAIHGVHSVACALEFVKVFHLLRGCPNRP
jgi:hypothetical protein